MEILQTAERVSHNDLSDNYVFQRSILAYVEAAKQVSGEVLEIGTGSGYGIELIAANAEAFVTIDKYIPAILNMPEIKSKENLKFIQMTVPPLAGIAEGSFDFVISFQVIEHIEDDKEFVKEIYRVLKPGGKFILTTPNKKMSLTRNPWHVREYTIQELDQHLKLYFPSVLKLGVFGNEKAQDYYEKNKAAVAKITRFDVLDLQYRLPRWMLQIPYDLLNRLNRKRLLKHNNNLVSDLSMEDFCLAPATDTCLDLFFIAEK
jgi:ubiquinone/menaquinone biosynthesis C-methylase UbiE